MNLRLKGSQRQRDAFTIVEVVVAMGIIGVLALALYTGMTTSTYAIRLARENLRATEILVEKTEAIRLFTWDQLTDSTYIPTNFTASYYDDGTTNNTTPGISYTGTVVVTTFPSADRNYSNDMKLITVSLSWVSGKMPRSRTLTTYFGRYGIQNYVAN